MLVDREVKTHPNQEFVRPVKQCSITHGAALGVAIKYVAAVDRQIGVPGQAAVNKTDKTYIAPTKSTSWTCAALQLIEATGVIGTIPIPAIKRNYADAQRIVRSREANLRACHIIRKARFSVLTRDERSIRQIARRDCE